MATESFFDEVNVSNLTENFTSLKSGLFEKSLSDFCNSSLDYCVQDVNI